MGTVRIQAEKSNLSSNFESAMNFNSTVRGNDFMDSNSTVRFSSNDGPFSSDYDAALSAVDNGGTVRFNPHAVSAPNAGKPSTPFTSNSGSSSRASLPVAFSPATTPAALESLSPNFNASISIRKPASSSLSKFTSAATMDPDFDEDRSASGVRSTHVVVRLEELKDVAPIKTPAPSFEPTIGGMQYKEKLNSKPVVINHTVEVGKATPGSSPHPASNPALSNSLISTVIKKYTLNCSVATRVQLMNLQETLISLEKVAPGTAIKVMNSMIHPE